MAVKKSSFGTYPDGREVTLYTLTNEKGMEVSVTDLGAIIVRIIVPDAEGKKDGLNAEERRACIQLLPGYMAADGFFIAKFQKPLKAD